MKAIYALTSLLSVISLAAVAPAQAESPQPIVTIGTGAVTGVYYASGGAICRLMKESRTKHGTRCAVESTAASVYNINAIRNRELDFGIVQTDTQYNAWKGIADFKGQGAFTDLRSVFTLYPEPLTLVVGKGSNIKRFEDLKGKRFNIGNPGSGTRNLINHVLTAYGMTTRSMIISQLKPEQQISALCSNQIDGFAYAVGHPAPNIREAIQTCGGQLVSLSGPIIDRLVNDHPYYAIATIPAKLYPGTPHEIKAFGPVAGIVTSARVPDEQVYALVKSVFDNLDEFKSLHPAHAGLNQKRMISDDMAAPLHPGAIRYYKERGWL